MDIDNIIARMRASDRTELVHYAGAAHRDPFARAVVAAWLADQYASEALLRSRAHHTRGDSVSPDDCGAKVSVHDVEALRHARVMLAAQLDGLAGDIEGYPRLASRALSELDRIIHAAGGAA